MAVLIILLLLAGYLIGSIPWGWIICKFFCHFDIRHNGSGNFGGTNVIRVLGAKYGKPGMAVGGLVILLDAFKGFLIFWLVPLFTSWSAVVEPTQLIWIGTGLSAILGHIYSFWFWGKGGKGVATSLGVLLVLMTVETLVALAIFIVIVSIYRYISLGSIIAAITVSLSHFLLASEWLSSINLLFTDNEFPLTLFVLLVSILVIYAHRQNIVRIINGTEKKIIFSKLKS